MNTSFFIAAHALILRNDGTFLILRRSLENTFKPTWWDIPGGVVEPGESLEEALSREIQEETGLIVQIIEPLHTYTDLDDYPSRQIVQMIFKCQLVSGKVVLNPMEHDEYKWIHFDSIPKDLRVLPFFSTYLQKK